MGSDAEIKAGRAGSSPSGGVGASVRLGLGRLRAWEKLLQGPRGQQSTSGSERPHLCGWLPGPSTSAVFKYHGCELGKGAAAAARTCRVSRDVEEFITQEAVRHSSKGEIY